MLHCPSADPETRTVPVGAQSEAAAKAEIKALWNSPVVGTNKSKCRICDIHCTRRIKYTYEYKTINIDCSRLK